MRGVFWLLVLWGVGMVSVGGVRAYGIAQADSSPLAWMLPDLTCPAPCWSGWRVVLEAGPQAEARLEQDPRFTPESEGNFAGTWRYQEVGYLWYGDHLSLYMEGSRLGDWLAALGPPDYQALLRTLNPHNGREEYLVTLYYQPEQVKVLLAINHQQRLSVDSPIQSVQYPRQYFTRPFLTFDWLGLLRLEFYPPFKE
jgi:hypothetical protein